MAKQETDKATTAKAQKPGFDADGKAYPGVDPDTGERKTVTLEGLKKEFGKKEGERKYREIAQAGGFFNPSTVASDYAPDMAIHGLKGEQAESVAKILASTGADDEEV